MTLGLATPLEPSTSPATRRLIDANGAARKAGCSSRHWLRLCDVGMAPWGVKLGALRRWDEAEIDAWIAGGCKPVQQQGGGNAE